MLSAICAVCCGAFLLSLFAALFYGRLERPFTQLVGRTIGFVSDHLRTVAVVSVVAFLAVWLFIGLVSLVQWRKDRRSGT